MTPNRSAASHPGSIVLIFLALLALTFGIVWIVRSPDPEEMGQVAKPMKEFEIPEVGMTLDMSTGVSQKNLLTLLKRITREPHPMGSPEQKKLARDLQTILTSFGLSTQLQKFSITGPNLNSRKFGGPSIFAQPSTLLHGENIIAISQGPDACTLVVAGHYDTKLFTEFRFVGANDSGSSTALQLELARLVSLKRQQQQTETGKMQRLNWLRCNIAFIFFDGEEALLPDWNDGIKMGGIRDHLYGSRAFLESIEHQQHKLAGKPLDLTLVIDMVGHQNQKLFITAGSDPIASQGLIAHAVDVNLSRVPFRVEDDHIPFLQAGLPFVHIIDWSNLREWHTEKDTLEIISLDRLARFGRVLENFMEREGLPIIAKESP